MRNKILSLLALLLTAVTGAWAEGTVTVTEIKASEMPTSWENNNNPVKATDLPGFTAVTRDEAKALGAPAAEGDIFVFYAIYNNTFMGLHWNDGVFDDTDAEFSLGAIYALQDVFKFYYVASAEAPITVEPVEGKTNEWTFSMPGSDVVLTPQYAPAAQLDENGAPAAVSGLEIAADAAIITAGQSAQGTLLYAVGTSETEKPALTAFSATLPNAKDQTAAGNYYVWYYIQGQDTPQGQEPTADNTFNDSEIMGPVTVELLTNEHTLNIKQSPNITVTVAGTAKTPTDDKVTPVTTGQEVKIKAKEGYKFRKVEVKKAAPATALAPALENGATVVIICNWGYATTTFTYTNNGGTFSGQASGLEANYFNNGLELNGKNLSFSASNVDVSEYLSVGITFNTESSAYSYTGKGEDFASFTISVNGTDVTDQLTELK